MAVDGARKNLAAAQANLSRLNDLFGYLTVRAPFDGVVTVRNVDVGALVNDGSTLLFRVAQTGRLRIYLNVPQGEADSVHAGQSASISVADRPNQKFPGTVTRTSNSLDPATRTLLAEVQILNGGGQLLPGMFSQVDLSVPRRNPPLLIPGDALVERRQCSLHPYPARPRFRRPPGGSLRSRRRANASHQPQRRRARGGQSESRPRGQTRRRTTLLNECKNRSCVSSSPR
jgi:hypothetical protein